MRDAFEFAPYVVSGISRRGDVLCARVALERGADRCPTCGSDRVSGFGARDKVVRDLPVLGSPVELVVSARRFKCMECSARQGRVVTFAQGLPGIDSKRAMTTRLVAWLGEQASVRTFARLASDVGCAEGTVRSIFADYVAGIDARASQCDVRCMGLVTVHMARPRCVVFDADGGRVLDVLRTDAADALEGYLRRMAHGDDLSMVLMGFDRAYRDAVVSARPSARAVVDKSCVLGAADAVVDATYRRVKDRLDAAQRRALARRRAVLDKRELDLTPRERGVMEDVGAQFPELARVCKAKNALFDVYEGEGASADAWDRFREWRRLLPGDVAEVFAPWIERVFGDWRDEVVGYFDGLAPSSYATSCARIEADARGFERGYSFDALRVRMLQGR